MTVVHTNDGVDPIADEHVSDPSETQFMFQTDQGEINLEELEADSSESDTEGDVEERYKHLIGNPLFIQELLKKKKVRSKRIISSMDISGKRVPKGRILGWYYDSELKIFALKRHDGVQYMDRKLAVFSSLPKTDILRLARLPLNNPEGDMYANYVHRIIRNEVGTDKFDKIKPRKGKIVKSKERDRRTGKRLKIRVFPAVKCVKEIPLKTMPQDILGNMKHWVVDPATGEAVMSEHDDEAENEERELLRIYD